MKRLFLPFFTLLAIIIFAACGDRATEEIIHQTEPPYTVESTTTEPQEDGTTREMPANLQQLMSQNAMPDGEHITHTNNMPQPEGAFSVSPQHNRISSGSLISAAISPDGGLYVWGDFPSIFTLGHYRVNSFVFAGVLQEAVNDIYLSSNDTWDWLHIAEYGEEFTLNMAEVNAAWAGYSDAMANYGYRLAPRRIMDGVVSVQVDAMNNVHAILENGDVWNMLRDDVTAQNIVALGQGWDAPIIRQDGSVEFLSWFLDGDYSSYSIIQAIEGQQMGGVQQGSARLIFHHNNIGMVQAIAHGAFTYFAITHNNELWGWGWNEQNILNTSGGSTQFTPVHIMDNVAQVSVGNNHALVVTPNGRLYTFGVGNSGQLGQGNRFRSPRASFVMDNVAQISAGGEHSMVITNDGVLWAFGENLHGQLGNGTNQNSYTPVQIMTNVASVSAGDSHTIATTNNGAIWVWGNNLSGQLGNGETGIITTPTRITLQ